MKSEIIQYLLLPVGSSTRRTRSARRALSLILMGIMGIMLVGCATTPAGGSRPTSQSTNAAPTHEKTLRLLAAIGSSEAIIEDARNSAVLQEVSDALDVFCGSGEMDSLFLITLVKRLPDRLHISEDTKRRIGMVGLLVEELGGEIKPADYVAWGGVGCAVREGIKRGIALAKASKEGP